MLLLKCQFLWWRKPEYSWSWVERAHGRGFAEEGSIVTVLGVNLLGLAAKLQIKAAKSQIKASESSRIRVQNKLCLFRCFPGAQSSAPYRHS